jgi:ABC-2 type transport system permease protein
MTAEERFAIDQYLMRGGAVVMVAGNYILPAQQFPGGLSVEPVAEGLKDMLASYGVTVEEAMVLDPQNEPLPIQVQRSVGGMQVIEIQELPYPPFVDIRPDGMDEESPIVSNLPAVTMQWVSPLAIDEEKNQDREATVLLQSTQDSWLRTATNVQPNPEVYPLYGFPIEGLQESRPLAVAIRGSFESYFKDRGSPLQATGTLTSTTTTPQGTIEVSPESSRLVVVGSAEFIDDAVLEISRQMSMDRYLNNLQFMQNAVDWSVEDEDLLSIRSRGTYARLLKHLEKNQQSFWEGLNYGLVLLALLVIGGVWTLRRRREQPMPLVDEMPDFGAGSSVHSGENTKGSDVDNKVSGPEGESDE